MTPELTQIKSQFQQLDEIVTAKKDTIDQILTKIDRYDLDQEFEDLLTLMGELQEKELEFYRENTKGM